jgi:hypothetical protein
MDIKSRMYNYDSQRISRKPPLAIWAASSGNSLRKGTQEENLSPNLIQ